MSKLSGMSGWGPEIGITAETTEDDDEDIVRKKNKNKTKKRKFIVYIDCQLILNNAQKLSLLDMRMRDKNI